MAQNSKLSECTSHQVFQILPHILLPNTTLLSFFYMYQSKDPLYNPTVGFGFSHSIAYYAHCYVSCIVLLNNMFWRPVYR